MTDSPEDITDNMPEILAIRATSGAWGHYLCRSGRGGAKDTNYVKESRLSSLSSRVGELEGDCELWDLSTCNLREQLDEAIKRCGEIIEECAKVADRFAIPEARRIADEIRSLKDD